MKRAPIIPKSTANNTNSLVSEQATTGPAAPMVDSLITRVGAMTRGNSINLPVCGREVKFILECIPGDKVAELSNVWGGNERDQELLTEEALDDLIPSFLLSGQQTPAFGRKVSDHIEVADGSRRRMAAILTSSVYRVLVGDLDDEQMMALSRLGNDYRPTSAFERGKRYISRLENEFSGNISALSDAENISRKIITRCINTAKLPKSLMSIFAHPGELSARAGDSLFKSFSDKEQLLQGAIENLLDRKKMGAIFESEEIIEFLMSVLKDKTKTQSPSTSRHQYAPGATAIYKGEKIILNLDRDKLPAKLIQKIEEILKGLEKKGE
ncbi:chromosome partitioning protein, ParB family [Kosakonia radicincitans]|uniref:Chromosome partitioning protein, ParB family n=1 Tax=Kosakonia radicincitans TaxID=283686 RepID=A0AAX2EZ58_9ENTR|nr:ParB/RepB/Spo0J family plasmid partition protein [Kosakonia radicincitans]SFF38614.1 chromosome partitioning protein, ParB family [Kosakonia radicincitans]SFR26337.1 chromosome partitioning protein, ParB family [Kosakonia radicincitans]SFU16880.1 chromosome partitioning protein, ParB family [Kosakonia radicincitans]SFY32442.1 chromosome partitioning protein, ParB family [Kosakonia radicincitans]